MAKRVKIEESVDEIVNKHQPLSRNKVLVWINGEKKTLVNVFSVADIRSQVLSLLATQA